jgi:hypothetical protein
MAKKPQKRESYNPLLKSYPDSEKINSVSEGAEVLYVRLIAASDDAGRYWGNPMMVLAKLFTHRMTAGQITVEEVESRLQQLAAVELIHFYEVDGKRYLQMVEVVKRLRSDITPQLFCPPPLADDVTTTGRRRNDDGPPTGPNRTQPNPTQPLSPDLKKAINKAPKRPANCPGSGAYADVTEGMLRSETETDEWIEAAKRFRVIGSECDRYRVHAMAVHCLRDGSHPERLFVANLKAANWKVLTQDDEEIARLRVAKIEAMKRGPPMTEKRLSEVLSVGGAPA